MIKVRYPPHRYFAENSKIVKKASTVKCNIYKTTDYPRFLGAFLSILTLPVSISNKERKLSQIFIFLIFCGASKSIMKVFNEGL